MNTDTRIKYLTKKVSTAGSQKAIAEAQAELDKLLDEKGKSSSKDSAPTKKNTKKA